MKITNYHKLNASLYIFKQKHIFNVLNLLAPAGVVALNPGVALSV
jgi:hypothetical protein